MMKGTPKDFFFKKAGNTNLEKRKGRNLDVLEVMRVTSPGFLLLDTVLCGFVILEDGIGIHSSWGFHGNIILYLPCLPCYYCRRRRRFHLFTGSHPLPLRPFGFLFPFPFNQTWKRPLPPTSAPKASPGYCTIKILHKLFSLAVITQFACNNHWQSSFNSSVSWTSIFLKLCVYRKKSKNWKQQRLSERLKKDYCTLKWSESVCTGPQVSWFHRTGAPNPKFSMWTVPVRDGKDEPPSTIYPLSISHYSSNPAAIPPLLPKAT